MCKTILKPFLERFSILVAGDLNMSFWSSEPYDLPKYPLLSKMTNCQQFCIDLNEAGSWGYHE